MNRALLIGINQCQGADTLMGTHDDVDRFKTFLVRNCGFDAAQCTTLLDPQADHQNIPSALQQLINATIEDPFSTAVFYFSGHGYADYFGPELVPELVPQPGTYSMLLACDWRALPARALNSEQFRSIVEPIQSSNSRLIAVFDCCHVGGMHVDDAVRIKGLKNDKLTPDQYASARPFFRYMENAVGVTACAMNETTADVSSLPASGFTGPGGAFSMFLLQQLQGAGDLQSMTRICARVQQLLADARFRQTPAAMPPLAAERPFPILHAGNRE